MSFDLISRSALIAHIGDLGSDPEDDTTLLTMGQACAITHKCIVYIVKAEPAVDAVSRPVFEQIQWERDCAMQQLKDHDIPFGGIAPDVVKVVRCKNCRRCDGFPGEEIEPNEIGICRINRVAVKPDDFCSYGERKAENG